MRTFIVAGVTVCLLSAAPAMAVPDSEGCKDYPLFSRFPGTYISVCESSQFDMRAFPTGPPDENQNTKPVEIEGPVWRIEYQINENVTPPSGLQIMRNFENATKKAGGTLEGQYPGWCKANYDSERMPGMGNGCTSYALTMKFLRGGKEVWAFLQADETGGHYALTVTQREEMRQDIVVNELVDKLSKDGFVSLHINFDTGKATIKSDSQQMLDDAANALKAAPDLRVEVGGHTDNVGSPEANLNLSQDRAQSVMAALVARGVKADMLTAKGYGQTQTIADNRTEDGRAKNRRVELVKK